MAAQGAELEHFAPAPAEVVDAIIAHHFAAMRALVSDFNVGMPWTNERAVGQDDRRGGGRELKFWNRHGYIGVLHHQFHVAESQLLSGNQWGLDDGFPGDKGAVGR